jgi:hypothetical protein
LNESCAEVGNFGVTTRAFTTLSDELVRCASEPSISILPLPDLLRRIPAGCSGGHRASLADLNAKAAGFVFVIDANVLRVLF